MRRRAIAALAVLCTISFLMPSMASRAAVMPYFIAVNDELLPYSYDTMPLVFENDIFVPVTVFEQLNIWSIVSDDKEHVMLYRGVDKYLYFNTTSQVAEDFDGNILQWPPTRRIGERVYAPLRNVCSYFGISFFILDVPDGILAEGQARLIRIVTDSLINNPTFMAINTNAIRRAYSAFNEAQATPGHGTVSGPNAENELLPDFNDITVYINFAGITDGNAVAILDFLDAQTAFGYYSAFFVNTSEIEEKASLIRRIVGSGHSIGIWLEHGTYAEYREASAWLFEAAKVRTVLISAAQDAGQAAAEAAAMHGLIYWESHQEAADYESLTVDGVIPMIPTEDGVVFSILLPCSANVALILPGVYSYLRSYGYNLAKITDMSRPAA